MTDGLEANIKKYSEQIAQDPKSRAFVPLSDAYRQLGRYDEAISVAQEGLRLNPHYLAGKIALARALFENGDADQAYELLDAVLLTAPDNLLANRIFAEIAAQMGLQKEAVDALKRVIAMEPNDARSRALLERIEKKAQAPVAPEPAPAEPVEPAVPAAPILAPAPVAAPVVATPTVNSPTLAELYRAQGHEKEALKVYENLKLSEKVLPPHRQMYETLLKRISERRKSL